MTYDDKFLEIKLELLELETKKYQDKHPNIIQDKMDYFLWRIEAEFNIPKFYFNREEMKDLALTSPTPGDFFKALIENIFKYHEAQAQEAYKDECRP